MKFRVLPTPLEVVVEVKVADPGAKVDPEMRATLETDQVRFPIPSGSEAAETAMPTAVCSLVEVAVAVPPVGAWLALTVT